MTQTERKIQRGMFVGPCLLLAVATAGGCCSPYYADRGAVFGGAMGAGVGAVAGAAVGDPLIGAALGAGVGAATGAVVGNAIDDVEARNRAEIAARLGRPAPNGAVTTQDVVAMTHAGVSEEIIATHIRTHGLAASLGANDLISLQQLGVSPRVIQAMQTAPGPGSGTLIAADPQPYPVAVYPAPPPVIYEPVPPPIIVGPYGPPPPPWRRHPHGHRHGGVSWGVSLSSDNFR